MHTSPSPASHQIGNHGIHNTLTKYRQRIGSTWSWQVTVIQSRTLSDGHHEAISSTFNTNLAKIASSRESINLHDLPSPSKCLNITPRCHQPESSCGGQGPPILLRIAMKDCVSLPLIQFKSTASFNNIISPPPNKNI